MTREEAREKAKESRELFGENNTTQALEAYANGKIDENQMQSIIIMDYGMTILEIKECIRECLSRQ